MKKIFNILLLAAFALPMFTACETDDESNPTLKEPSTFVLNVPAYATNNVYDMKNTKTIELSCSQPDYGFTAATTYNVQVALNPEFTETTEESAANYTELTTTYTTAKMDVVGSELNTAILDLWSVQNEGVDFPTNPISVYIRLKATITGSNRGVCLSNTIELPKVLGNSSIDKLEVPKTMFVTGSMLDADWKVWKPMVMVSGLDGQFWSLVYFGAKDEFKFGTKEDEYIGADDARVTLSDKANAGATGIAGGNISVATAGWYVVYIKAAVKGSDYTFAVTLYPGNVYLFGATNGGTWDYSDQWMFTAPADKDGSFVSPAMTASGEARICVKTDVDWWRTECTLHDGEIFYRENNAVNDSWGVDMGADYSIAGSAGKTVHLNFTAGTGELK